MRTDGPAHDHGGGPTTGAHRRLILLALDELCPRLIDRFIAEGRLPNFVRPRSPWLSDPRHQPGEFAQRLPLTLVREKRQQAMAAEES